MQATVRFALIALLMTVAGCGSSDGKMQVCGNVSFDGQAVELGTIVFAPVDSARYQSTGGVIKDGRYDVAAVNGLIAKETYKVEITATKKNGKKIRNMLNPGGPDLDDQTMYIPQQYNVKSTLKVTVSAKASENQHDFNLQKKSP